MTDKEYVAQDERKVTWGLSRKLSDGDYGGTEVSIYMTDFAPKSTKNMAKFVADKSEAAFDGLKTQVWDALGLEFEFDELGKPKLVEVATPAPQPAPAAAPPAPAPAVVPAPSSGRGPKPSIAQVGVYADAPMLGCPDCNTPGIETFYDNRADNDEKIKQGKKIWPDFKCKACEGGNGKGKPLYRPGSYDYNQAVGQGPAATAPPAPTAPTAAEALAPADETIF